MIGQYPVERELGRGGMGVVYLARDPRLNRHVAIKVLPAAFVSDPMRLQRFEREARTLAALNHRNVGMIFGLEDADGQRLLVLEYIPGRTLTDMLARPLPLDETLRMAQQIAEGLEIAHERDVVHRDLKPDNVRVTPDGLVKLLDFGLATQASAEAATGSQLTQAGMVMGTPGYMSPEQARGLPTDKRTDIWAFGCVLFEMLSGYKAFGGETVSDCIAAILDREPDYTLLPARTPNRLRELLHKLLVKEPRRRLRDIGDARIEIEDVLSQPQSGWYQAAGTATARAGTLARLTMPLGGEVALTNSPRGAIAISPDGTSVVFVAGRAPATMLYMRRMDGVESRPIPGTAGGDAPFFSPDGARVAFFADGKLKRVALSGGAPATLCAAPRPQGGCWDATDTIYFIPDWQKGLMRISNASGTGGAPGAPELVADPDLATGELALLAPDVLPGSRYVLVAAWSGAGGGYDDALISAIDLRSGPIGGAGGGATLARRPLIHGGCNPKYLPSGHLLYSRGGSVLAVAFDPEKLEIFGQPMAVEDRVLGNSLGGSSHFAAAGDGTFICASGPIWEPRATLLHGGRAGDPMPLIQETRAFAAPAVSPAGRLLCVQVQGATDHLWLYDFERPSSAGTRLTFNADNTCPVFSPDGKRIAFRSNMSGRHELYWMGVDGSGIGGGPEPLFASDRSPAPCCFADGGKTIIFTQQRGPAGGATGGGSVGGSALEIWGAPVDNAAAARPIVQTPTSAWGASVSPDNQFIAYVSDETGRPEVYVQQYPGPGARRQVSTEGGLAPIWSRVGGELFFRVGDQIIGVRIAVEPTFMVGRPRVLFQGATTPPTHLARNYDLLPSGDFALLRGQEDAARVTSLNVTLNWFTELRRRVPVPQTPTLAGTRMGSSHFVSGGMTSAGTPMPTRPQQSQTPAARPSFPSDAKTIG
jgi:eukaryotic-like serine/threonine-protein kinase